LFNKTRQIRYLGAFIASAIARLTSWPPLPKRGNSIRPARKVLSTFSKENQIAVYMFSTLSREVRQT
jgi:hypothetical protein